MNKDIIIIDDFLEKDIFLGMKDFIFSNNFPWFFNKGKVKSDDNYFQFFHYFYKTEQFGGYVNSFQHFSLIQPLLEKINFKYLIRIKLNLTFSEKENFIYGMHTDIQPKDFIKTGIFYFNTTNGGTIFENEKTVDCVENRFVYFPSRIKHSGISCTDEKTRAVLNLNYIE